MKIYISGSLAFDRIMDFSGNFSDHILPEKLHILNVCFAVDGMEEKFGGTAGNIAYSLSLLGERPVVMASVGEDFERYGEWMRQQKLTLEGVRIIKDEFTAGAYITTDKSDNQITAFNPGAMKFPCKHNPDYSSSLENLAIISPGNIDDMLHFSRRYRQEKVSYIFDPGQSIPALSADQLIEMISGSDMLISNDYELELICRTTKLDKTALLERTKTVITTLGEAGAIIHSALSQEKIPAVKVASVLDPTGAGDAFRSGLIKGICLQKSIPAAARMGAVAASFAVEYHGTQEHAFDREKFCNRYQKAFRETLDL